MKARSVTDYDWAMYIDASGDDGFAFERGSSTTYTVNSFICETSEIEHNIAILNQIKDLLKCPHNLEMKSTTIIKSKKRDQVCDLLSELHGALFQFVIFKEMLDPSSFSTEELDKHIFSTLAHGFTIGMAASFHEHFQKSLCIIVDNMKAVEVLGTKEMVKRALQNVDYMIKFCDSKSAEHPLLQISDYFAGLTNRACMDHEKAISKNPSINRCSPCNISRNLCRSKPGSLQTPLFFDIQRYVNLYVIWSDKDSSTIMGNGLRMFPDSFTKRYRFFDCVLRRKMSRYK